MDVSNVLSGLNLSRSYAQMAEETKASPQRRAAPQTQSAVITSVTIDEVREEAEPAPVARAAPTVSEPVAVASAPQTHTSPEKVTQPRDSALSPENLSRKDWSFVVDNEILIKELDLGKDLI